MDLDSAADELYRASPDDFVERRKQQAAEARAAKDRDLAKAILALRRPTRSAWLVNLLAKEAPTEVTALLELGAALADAQRRGSGADLRRLSQERHQTIETLTRRAVALAADRGHHAAEATRQEVSQTLQAALADQEVAGLVRAGRVVQAASYGGFGPLDLLGALPSAAPAAGQEDEGAAASGSAAEDDSPAQDPAGPDVSAGSEVDAAAQRARREAEATVRAAGEERDEARRRADEAKSRAEEQTSRADELAEQVETLRAQLEEAEAAERQAQDEARAARKEHQQAQRTLSDAERTLREAEQALTDVVHAVS